MQGQLAQPAIPGRPVPRAQPAIPGRPVPRARPAIPGRPVPRAQPGIPGRRVRRGGLAQPEPLVQQVTQEPPGRPEPPDQQDPLGQRVPLERQAQLVRQVKLRALQGSWGLGALLSSAAYALLFDSIGWRGLLLIGVLPALVIVYIRKYVKEPEVWIENRRKRRAENREFRAPLFSIFRRSVLGNTLTACWLMASAFVVGYSVGGMFPSYLQKDLCLPTGFIALPIMLQSLMFFISAILWGWAADRFGRRPTLMITALLTIPVAPLYLMTTDYTMVVVFCTLQGFFGGGGMHTQWPHYLSERSRLRCGRRPLASAIIRGRSSAAWWGRS
jgi:MFS family permease